MKPFLVVCLNPTLQRTYFLEDLKEGEVNRCKEHFLDASGKGVNVGRVLRQLGAEVIHLTHAGGRFRELFVEMTALEGITMRAPDSGSEVRFCNTLVNRKRETTTEIVEEGPPISAGVEEAIMNGFEETLDASSTVILSGSKAEGYSQKIFPKMVRDAKATGHRVILDYRGGDLQNAIEFRPDVIKPNFSEFCATFLNENVDENSDHSVFIPRATDKMKKLWESYGIRTVLTRGAREILIYSEDGMESYQPPEIRPVNTIGCGDSMCAGLAYALEQGADLKNAVVKGAECAALCAVNKRPGSIAP